MNYDYQRIIAKRLSIEPGVNLSMNKLANLTFDNELPRIQGDPRIFLLVSI